jgi:hypothetical protein
MQGPTGDASVEVTTGLATLGATATATGTLATLTTANGTTVTGPSATASASAALSPRSAALGLGGSLSTATATVSGVTADGIQYDGTLAGPSLSIDATAEAELGWDGVEARIEVDVNATLVDASGSISRTMSFEVAGEQYEVDLTVEASGRIAAEGSISLEVTIGTDGTVSIKPDAEGFAGIEASLSATIEVSHEGSELVTADVDIAGRMGTPFTPEVDGDISLGADGVLELTAVTATPTLSISAEARVDTAAVGNAAYETAESYIFGPSDENAAPPPGVE